MPAGVLHIAPFDYMIIWLEFELPFPKVVCSGHKHTHYIYILFQNTASWQHSCIRRDLSVVLSATHSPGILPSQLESFTHQNHIDT